MLAHKYEPAHNAIFYYATEIAPYPSASVPAPLAPSSLSWAGFSDVPQVEREEGTEVIHGIGSKKPQVIIPGAKVHSLSANLSIGNKPFIEACATADETDFYLLSGVSNKDGDGFSKAIRFAKCHTLALHYAQGQEIKAQSQFWGLAEEDANPITPSSSEFVAPVAPLMWHDVRQINIGGENLREVVLEARITINRNLVRKVVRPDSGDGSDWSRTVYALRVGMMTYECEIAFDTPDAVAYALSLNNGQSATGQLQIVAANTSGSKTFTVSSTYGRLSRSARNGSDPSQSLSSTVSLSLLNISVS